MFFQTKKVQIEILSEYLKSIRQDAGLSQKEVAGKLGISVKILRDLEEGLFGKLPSSVYVKGFLGKLAEVYRVDEGSLLRQFEIERKIFKNVEYAASAKNQSAAGFSSGWVITPKKISLAGAAVFAGVTVIYIVWQVLAIGNVPVLEISSPENFAVIENSFVEVKGRTDPGASLTVNNQSVFVESNGEFSTQASLSSGPKELVVVARNRFNKTTTRSLSVIGQGKGAKDKQINVRLELEFQAGTDIGYRLDGDVEVREFVPEGTIKLLEAKKLILFSASDAGGVKVKVNGQNLGFLGREGERLVDIPFSAESGNIK